MKTVYIIARNAKEAKAYREQEGLSHRQGIYVSGPAAIEGICGCASFARVEGFQDHPKAREILNVVEAAQKKDCGHTSVVSD